MKFGIFHIVPWHESRTQQQALEEALEQIELADELGIEEAWLGEHRFSRHGLLSGIFPFLGMVAGRTKRIRIGTAVIVLPLHNPILCRPGLINRFIAVLRGCLLALILALMNKETNQYAVRDFPKIAQCNCSPK